MPARLLFDECLSGPATAKLRELVSMDKGECPEVRHIFEFATAGTFDDVWIPRLAPDGWTVVTGDRGSRPNRGRGEKLPRLCARFDVTHVLLSAVVHNRTSFEKLLTILSVWYELLDLATDPARRGARYCLEPTARGERGRGRLLPRVIPPKQLTMRDEYRKSLGDSGT